MKKITLTLAALALMFSNAISAEAYTIGYADFQKVLMEYTYARNAYKDIPSRILSLRR